MKKWICLLLVVATVFTYVGCTKKEVASTPQGDASVAEQPIAPLINDEKKETQSRYLNDVKMVLEQAEQPLSTPFYNDNLSLVHDAVMVEDSLLLAYTNTCVQYRMNPIAAFFKLVNNGMFFKVGNKRNFHIEKIDAFDEDYVFKNLAQDVIPQEYLYTAGGCDLLMQDLMNLRGINGASLLLGSLKSSTMNSDFMFYYSVPDHCYYTYCVINEGQGMAVLAIYIRSKDSHYISDVEMQFLTGSYEIDGYAGIGIASGVRRNIINFDMISVISSLEQLMTGTAFLDDGGMELSLGSIDMDIPFSYALGDYQASLSVEDYEKNHEVYAAPSGEYCRAINYRIKK